MSRSSKPLWQKLLQSFCTTGILHFNCTVTIPSGSKVKAGGEKSSSTKTEHSGCILLFKVRISCDTLVLTFWGNCGVKLLCQMDLLWPFNWFEFVVEYINTVLELCFDFLFSNNVYWCKNSGRSPRASFLFIYFKSYSSLTKVDLIVMWPGRKGWPWGPKAIVLLHELGAYWEVLTGEGEGCSSPLISWGISGLFYSILIFPST